MKWCQPHWDRLRDAVKERGMWHLIATDGHEAIENLATEVEGEEAKFDPLMACCLRIFNAMLGSAGMRAMGQCPLCILVEDGQPELVENWVNGCTDEALQHCVEKGLVTAQ